MAVVENLRSSYDDDNAMLFKKKNVAIGRGADSTLESSPRLNLVFTASFLYLSVIFVVLPISGYRSVYIMTN